MGARENTDENDNHSSGIEEEVRRKTEGELNLEYIRDSTSSHVNTLSNDDNRVKRTSRVPKKTNQKQLTENSPRSSKIASDRIDSSKSQLKPSNNGQAGSQKTKRMAPTPKFHAGKKFDQMMSPTKPPSEVSEGFDDKTMEEVKEADGFEVKEADGFEDLPNCDHSVGTDDETGDVGENIDKVQENTCGQIEEMALKIEKLEEELREVAALEISLYSVVAEHGSSAHKVHTPARRISRLYIHACKHWSLERRATVARNSASGLVLIAKSCGSDISRLTFWLSNIVVLREIISQSFGNSIYQNVYSGLSSHNDAIKKFEEETFPVNWKNITDSKPPKSLVFIQKIDDWQETRTFLAALERIESWIFSKLVESVWWQIFNSYMHPSEDDLSANRSSGRLSGPALGDQQQGTFSLNLWLSAFHNAFVRLCPVRAGRNECGCLPVLARMVMEHCIDRLDVAMFNAILRESDVDIPSDPLCDPIVVVKVLPIPAGNLSFSSGAQLKNAIGNWSRFLTDLLGMDVEDRAGTDRFLGEGEGEGEGRQGGNARNKSFYLLNQLSDLLMLPKEMLNDSSIRTEVCPSIGLSIIIRILCNFSPDEFCLDPVSGYMLEVLNAEASLERRLPEKQEANAFPRPAATVVYTPPSLLAVAKKVADAGTGGAGSLERRASIVQRKGYTSDEDMDDLDAPLESIDKTSHRASSCGGTNARFMLLRQVWKE